MMLSNQGSLHIQAVVISTADSQAETVLDVVLFQLLKLLLVVAPD